LQVHCISGYYYDGPKPSEYLIQNHQVIYDAFADHNAELAARRIKEHIEMGHEYLFKAAKM
jgi:DNA-binding GntR family transcriptional regulator